jgi:hypothetical protein
MEAVSKAVSGIAYYADTIGFGEPATSLSQGMGLKPIGVQTWMKSGAFCSNGAEMWSYMNGIPQGNALGKTFAKRLSDAGMPGLKGLAPGIMEDIEYAFDPDPIMKAVFGTGYAACKREEKTVGDQDGRISTVDDNGKTVYFVENPETVIQRGGRSYQTRWTLDREITQSEWNSTPKTFCPNGTPKNGACSESFCGSSACDTPKWKPLVLLAVAGAGILLLGHGLRMRRKS